MPSQYMLTMRTGPNPGRTFEINRSEMTIGRDINNDIVINDAEVSRHHARLIAQAGGYVIEDTGSTNGTFVNGERLIGPHLLRPGELILLGENVSLSFDVESFDPDATIASTPGVSSVPPVRQEPPREAYSYTPPHPPEPAYAPRPTPRPEYAAPVPPGPVEAYPLEEEERGINRTWIYAGCGCLVVLLCGLIGAGFIFDFLNLYCTPPFDALSGVLYTCP